MPALLSPATPGPQPGLRSRSAREGASLYYLSASLGTWPLSSQPGMEPVPPALRQWRLSHRTPGRPRRRSSVSARWVARCPQALRVLCSHACGCGCPHAGSSETGCPPAQLHTAPPRPGVPDCALGRGCGPGPASWAQSLVARGSQDRAQRSPRPGPSHRAAASAWARGLLTPTFLAAGGPALTSASPRAGSLLGALTHTRQHLGWDGGGSLDPRGPLPVEAGSPQDTGPGPRPRGSTGAPGGLWGPLPALSRPWVPAAGLCRLRSLLGCPLSPSCPRTVGAVWPGRRPFPPTLRGGGRRDAGRAAPPEPRSPHLERAGVACLPSGGEVKQGLQSGTDTPPAHPVLGLGPGPAPCVLAWQPGRG